jgi:DNA (cytosine-5)-methyltransferase 1
MKQKPTIIDLFCGCGGLSYGLEQVGYEVILGIDNWGDALKTFAQNHPHAKTLEGDISKIDVADIKKLIGKQKIDVIVGGPPCQGFSLSGPRNFYDKRNKLYLEFIRLVKELKPRAFVVENVPGLAALFGGEVKNRIIEEFERLGYSVDAKILNASDYGVPQNRKRIVFVGIKGKKKFEFPNATHFDIKSSAFKSTNKKITVGEAIGDLPLLKNEMGGEEIEYKTTATNEYQKLMRKRSAKIFNHVASKHTSQTVKIVSLVPEGGNYKDLPEHLRGTRNFHVAWTRLHRQKQSSTIDTGHRHHFHPTQNRVPTVREAARIQSFPDDFKFLGTKTSQYKQVGNAVPPLLAAEIGKNLLKYL